ncbi:Hypothetical predicted protein [Mytilus galloprovincialis]|uniref:C1q domain-containing protein n=1 Tax=Mytilus galloprovincialis TaxID=29158 RepID=A0A8B6CQU3_MYTGA|nr:Hypothetical predicted protein [Mytilus galloprovincialis]
MVFDFKLVIYCFLCNCLSGIYADISGVNGDVSQIWKELNELKTVLLETRLDLSNTRKEFADSRKVLGQELANTKQTLKDTRQDLAETKRELNEIKKVTYRSKAQFDEIHKGNDQKRFLDTANELHELQIDMQNMHQLQVDVQNLKAKMAAVQLQVKISQTPRIGFTSTISQDVVNLGDNQVIRFDRVYTNEGSDYNSLTGIFTCEIPGLYAFYVHTLAEPGKHLETEITKNLQIMAYTYAKDKEAYSSGSNMAVMTLQKGDTVLVRSHGSQHDHNGSVIDSGYTSFSGFLIAP